tara:strand:+ start:235 stop:390 length:156 start_codon:yes stop_codon:yes gene_type:complete
LARLPLQHFLQEKLDVSAPRPGHDEARERLFVLPGTEQAEGKSLGGYAVCS